MTDCEPIEFDALLDRYESERSHAVRRQLRQRASTGGESFLAQARNTLIERPVSDGLKFAITLIATEEILRVILAVYLRSKDEAVALTRKLLSCDPRFDAALLECLREQGSADRLQNAVLIVLEILDEVSEGDKLVLSVSRLLKHQSPKLRSRAASFIARRRPQLPWISDLSNEADARVRANVVETLHEIKADFVAPLLLKHAADENNRVAGNALLGLYRLGEARSLRLIEEMFRDPRPAFRITGAWVMGQTGDVRFAATLAAGLGDTDAHVRRLALRSLGRIKDTLKGAQDANALRLAVRSRQSTGAAGSLIAAISDAAGAPLRKIPGTRFFLKAGGKYVRDYDVKERSLESAVQVALVACLPAADAETVGSAFQNAIEHCSAVRRSNDGFTLSKLSYDAQLRCVQEDPAACAAVVREALIDVALGSPNLHLIVAGACSGTHALDAMLTATAGSRTSVHVLALTPEWRTAGVRKHVQERGGYYLPVEQFDDLPQACAQCYSAIQHSYELTWREGEGAIELEVRCDGGNGSIACCD